jgi:hypothetical protein
MNRRKGIPTAAAVQDFSNMIKSTVFSLKSGYGTTIVYEGCIKSPGMHKINENRA